MNNNIDYEARSLNSVISDKLRERLDKLSIRSTPKKDEKKSLIDSLGDKIEEDYRKSEISHLSNALKSLNRLDSHLSSYITQNRDCDTLADEIRSLPALDAESLGNKAIIEAFKKDLRDTRVEIKKEISSSSEEIKQEIKAASQNLSVYYGGISEKNPYLRSQYPNTIHESILTTVNKLVNLYYERVNNFEYISASTEEIAVSDQDVRTIEEYERMYDENKITIKPKKRMFFIKEDPKVSIANAKRAAVEKAHALAVITKLSTLTIPANYENTLAAVDKLKAEYRNKYDRETKNLNSLNFENMANQVREVHQEERKAEEYQAELNRAERLGYELERAKKEGNQELIDKLVAEIRLLDIDARDQEFYVNKGQTHFKEEETRKQTESAIMHEEYIKNQENIREGMQELYNEARRQLEAEGKLDPYYVQGGVDGVNIVTSDVIDRLIKERVEELQEANRSINSGQIEYTQMTPEQVTIEYLKAINAIPDNATLAMASQNPDFAIIRSSVQNGADLTEEIHEALVRKAAREKTAYKLFKIDKSKYDALSAERRQKVIRYISLSREVDVERMQNEYAYHELQSQINQELRNMDLPSESQGRHL